MKLVDSFFSRLARKLAKLPNATGVYFFYTAKQELIYVGKATSLRSRVRNYFSAGGKGGVRRPIGEFIRKINDVKWQTTGSALEAIILEANLIKKFQPRYNVLGKDDKSWNYLGVTKEAFPRLVPIRQQEYALPQSKPGKQNKQNKIEEFVYVFGPYPGLNTTAALALLRKLFQFSTCQGAAPRRRPCFYYHLGQCRGVCTGAITPAEYRRQVVRPLVLLLQGKKQSVLKFFAREMKRASRRQQFEEAARARDQLKQLRRIQDVALLNRSFIGKEPGTPSLRSGQARIKEQMRIEGYDISNLGATEKVGSMVVFDQSGPVKSGYRKFIIRTVTGQSDVDCLAEVLERRLGHRDWPLPQLLLIDGGAPQVNRARQVLAAHHLALPLVGIAKGPQRKKNDFILNTQGLASSAAIRQWVERHQVLLIQVRNEAHRFAIQFHRARRDRV
ncbi:MAG: GIY-YIG nuclease family protein [Candidatus Magasanikbacteria bacterium]|nr:GIY-YIG nuclease family protein [Candidatus Magasanikbacteria bacterium]